jgi:hypothetical protein
MFIWTSSCGFIQPLYVRVKYDYTFAKIIKILLVNLNIESIKKLMGSKTKICKEAG